MTATGKLDKKALPSINKNSSMTSHADDAHPSSATEKFIAKLWTQILQMEIVDKNESFFDLGGFVINVIYLTTL